MKRIALALMLSTAMCSSGLMGQVAMRTDSLFSLNVGRTMRFIVLLPAGYDASKSYPVLYLLHGLGGNYTDWTARTKLRQYLEPYALIIVMPDADDSWYVNSFGDPHGRFEDYIINDLQGYVRSRFAIDTARQAIAGLSMGGYGAIMLALRHPADFFFAGGLSSALSMPRDFDLRRKDPFWKATIPNLMRIFGKRPGRFYDDHDVFVLYKRTDPDSLPYIYLTIGIQDSYRPFLPANRRLADSLRMRGVEYEYHESPGHHEWTFWDREIPLLLRRLEQLIRTGSKSLAVAFEKAITARGIEEAVTEMRALSRSPARRYYIDEGEMNALGFKLLGEKKAGDAIQVFKFNAESFPDSGNVFEGLGEGYLAAGDTAAAIRSYNRSLQLSPGNTNAVEKLKILEQK